MSPTKAGMDAAMTVVNHGVHELAGQLPGFVRGPAIQHLDSEAGQDTLYRLVYETIEAYEAVRNKQEPKTTSTAGEVHATHVSAMKEEQ